MSAIETPKTKSRYSKPIASSTELTVHAASQAIQQATQGQSQQLSQGSQSLQTGGGVQQSSQ